MDRGAWRATVHGVAKSQTWLKWLSAKHAGLSWLSYNKVKSHILLLSDISNHGSLSLVIRHINWWSSVTVTYKKMILLYSFTKHSQLNKKQKTLPALPWSEWMRISAWRGLCLCKGVLYLHCVERTQGRSIWLPVAFSAQGVKPQLNCISELAGIPSVLGSDLMIAVL